MQNRRSDERPGELRRGDLGHAAQAGKRIRQRRWPVGRRRRYRFGVKSLVAQRHQACFDGQVGATAIFRGQASIAARVAPGRQQRVDLVDHVVPKDPLQETRASLSNAPLAAALQQSPTYSFRTKTSEKMSNGSRYW